MRGRYDERTWVADPAADYAPPRYRRACRYRSFIPDPLDDITTIDLETSTVLHDAAEQITRLNSQARPALIPFARLLLRTESIASSRIEGLQTDEKALARAEIRAESGGRVGPEAQEILANIDAMELAVERAAQVPSLTVTDLCAIHAELMAGDRQAQNRVHAGVLRSSQNWIGGNLYNPCGATFVPPPPELVPELLEDLCRFLHRDDLPALAQAALAHAQFETIHPFGDGNGRTGRALIHAVLRRRGLAPHYVPPFSVILAENRQDYIAGLEQFRDGADVNQWLTLFGAVARRAAEVADGYLEEVRVLQWRWRTLLRDTVNPRADAVAWALIEALPAFPAITVQVATDVTGRTKVVVGAGLEQLEQAGVLRRHGSGRRNRVWEPAGLLDLLDDLATARRPMNHVVHVIDQIIEHDDPGNRVPRIGFDTPDVFHVVTVRPLERQVRTRVAEAIDYFFPGVRPVFGVAPGA